MPLPRRSNKPPQRSAPKAKRGGCCFAGSGALRSAAQIQRHSTRLSAEAGSTASSRGYAKRAGGALRIAMARQPLGALAARCRTAALQRNASPTQVSLAPTFDNGKRRIKRRLQSGNGGEL